MWNDIKFKKPPIISTFFLSPCDNIWTLLWGGVGNEERQVKRSILLQNNLAEKLVTCNDSGSGRDGRAGRNITHKPRTTPRLPVGCSSPLFLLRSPREAPLPTGHVTMGTVLPALLTGFPQKIYTHTCFQKSNKQLKLKTRWLHWIEISAIWELHESKTYPNLKNMSQCGFCTSDIS